MSGVAVERHRLLVTGDREWVDRDLIFSALTQLPNTTTVIDGRAPGADTLAHFNAERLGMATQRFRAYWSCKDYEADTGEQCALADGRHHAVHGRPAGVIRNQRMLDEGHPTQVYAFHDDLGASRGTADMVRRALKRGLQVTHFSHEHPEGQVL